MQETIKKKVKSGKSCGHDEIKSKDIRMFGEFAAPGLAIIMKNCIEKEKFPEQRRVSRVKAIFKKGSKQERENHRPISLLSIPSKVLEAIISETVDDHLIGRNISSTHQWAYKQGFSTELLLLHLTERWKEELDNGQVIGVLFIDFKKAFDSISHNILKDKLKNCGFRVKYTIC